MLRPFAVVTKTHELASCPTKAYIFCSSSAYAIISLHVLEQ